MREELNDREYLLHGLARTRRIICSLFERREAIRFLNEVAELLTTYAALRIELILRGREEFMRETRGKRVFVHQGYVARHTT